MVGKGRREGTGRDGRGGEGTGGKEIGGEGRGVLYSTGPCVTIVMNDMRR